MLFIVLKDLSPVGIRGNGIELRLDCIAEWDREKIHSLCRQHSVIFTLRKASQGGYFAGTERQRYALLESLLALGPAFVDLEYDTDVAFVQKVHAQFSHVKIILSYHNLECTPDNLFELLEDMRSPYVYAYKIACLAHSCLDALKMLQFVREQKGLKVSGLCMGVEGSITRILGPVFGNFIDYAVLDEESKTDSGQLTIDQLDGIYHYFALNASTALYGLIGDPVSRSMSHVTHNAFMRQYNWNAVYVKMRVREQMLPDFLACAKACGFLGLSVTTPLKESLFRVLSCMDPEAEKIQAVNTIVFIKGEPNGYNTDGIGALDALEERGLLKDKRILLLGAGGAAKAIAYEALRRKAHVTILNRTKERAISIAHHLGCTAESIENFPDLTYDVIINATSHPLPIDSRHLTPQVLAMDITSMPKMTAFLHEAKKKECTLIFGYEMFAHQAIQQLHLWLYISHLKV